jgi:hypothetical protein
MALGGIATMGGIGRFTSIGVWQMLELYLCTLDVNWVLYV